MALQDELKTRALELGFSAVGVTGAEPFVEAEAAARERTQEGLMDGLPWWTQRRIAASADPRRATPSARSVVALAFPYAAPGPDPAPDGRARGRIASYALGRDYHDVLAERLAPLRAVLTEAGHEAKTYVDHGWMLDRAAAARAGLGWLGKNTNLLVPEAGSYVLLAEIVTSAALDRDRPLDKSCGACDACLRVCPTGALVAPGVLDNRRCISFWTIEHRGVIPLEIRPLIGDWVFGCDLCQEVCPINAYPRRADPDPVALAAYRALQDPRPLLEDILRLDDVTFRDRYRGTAVWRARRPGLVRNACVALGNIGDRGSVPALGGALQDVDPLVRGHAAWALGRLGGPSARHHLEAALSAERDPWVVDECEGALEACGPLVVL
ncbi:MAG TPA: tRNA epoxyqueuosine(34) reductase QueG [Candidatus Limnocylindrales bacterium]|nr:tRNA epoxyqueuosine(34) reductase QueG [Candidatus Limnocylindrales bacterium]